MMLWLLIVHIAQPSPGQPHYKLVEYTNEQDCRMAEAAMNRGPIDYDSSGVRSHDRATCLSEDELIALRKTPTELQRMRDSPVPQ